MLTFKASSRGLDRNVTVTFSNGSKEIFTFGPVMVKGKMVMPDADGVAAAVKALVADREATLAAPVADLVLQAALDK